MTSMASVADAVQARARESLGSSGQAIYRMVADALRGRRATGGRLVDVGCGGGALWQALARDFSSYHGLDAVRYDTFPRDADFDEVDLDRLEWPAAAGTADVVAAVETIEHLENPWAFFRGLVRIARPGAWIVVTTPNQLSVLSLATLLVKHRFSNFQDSHYPAHRTALLEADLRRLAGESRLEDVAIVYSLSGRVPFTPWHYPRAIARLGRRALSDNLMLIARSPRA